MAHGDKLFERYVCVSVRVAHFFTHSREAPSLMDGVQCTDLAAGCGRFSTKLWEIYYIFFTGYVGKGKWTSVDHALLKVTQLFILVFKNFHV